MTSWSKLWQLCHLKSVTKRQFWAVNFIATIVNSIATIVNSIATFVNSIDTIVNFIATIVNSIDTIVNSIGTIVSLKVCYQAAVLSCENCVGRNSVQLERSLKHRPAFTLTLFEYWKKAICNVSLFSQALKKWTVCFQTIAEFALWFVSTQTAREDINCWGVNGPPWPTFLTAHFDISWSIQGW